VTGPAAERAATTADVVDRLRAIDTTSLVDAGGDLRVLPAELRPVGRSRRLAGGVVTADAQADLMSVIAGLAACGPGDVLVVAAGGYERAVAGELFATEALRRGLGGLVIDGRCRDSAVLAELELPVFARGMAPHAYPARALPRIQTPIMVGDVEVRPGDLVLGDEDGLVVGTTEAIAAVLEVAEGIQARERRLRAAVAAGRSLFEAMNVDEHLRALQAGQDSRLRFRELAADDPEADRT
jgi:regulator of RNase E activity RraA